MLLRLAFWLVLLVLLLPTDAQQQARLTNLATGAVERFGTFCDRNTKTCGVGSEVWATFLRKAEFGLRLLGDLLGAGGRQGPPEAPPGPNRRPGKADPRGAFAPPPDAYPPPGRGPRYPGGG